MWLYFENVCVCVCRNICDIRHIGFTSVMPLQDLWFLFSIVDSCCQKKDFYTDGAYQKYQTGENEFKMGEIFFGLWNLCAIVNGGTVWLYMLNISMMCECL